MVCNWDGNHRGHGAGSKMALYIYFANTYSANSGRCVPTGTRSGKKNMRKSENYSRRVGAGDNT